MESRSLQFITAACKGQLISGSPDTVASSVCTDSRKIQPGDLFFAIRGDRFDGHEFVQDVAAKGAAAVVVQRSRVPVPPPACAIIAVDDTRGALGRLAARYRTDFQVATIAVAGSNGKTTTKEFIASVLRQKLKTLWSDASFNNDIGVPLTLLRLDRQHQAAVLEAGTNHPGELAPLIDIIAPQFGVVTSIGREHLEFFRDLAGVAREEGALAELLPVDGKLFLNGDTEWADPIAHRSRATVIRVGLDGANQWRGLVSRQEKQGTLFRVECDFPQYTGEYRVALLGKHQVVNALFAIALGAELGLDRADIQRGLAECKPLKMRLQLWEHNGVRVLDDAYNANADSTLAALQTLQELPCKGRRVAVLGDMSELGDHAHAAHEEVGRRAAEWGVGQLFAVGKMATVTARAAREAGLNRVIEFQDVESAADAVRQFVKPADIVLLKASRSARLERIAETLKSVKA